CAWPWRKKRRLASASISVSRDAPGPMRCDATFSSSSTRNASTPRLAFFARSRSLRSASIAAEGVERTSAARRSALCVQPGGVRGEDDPAPAAGRTLLREDLARPVGHVLARHLDEAEGRDLDDVGLRPVTPALGHHGTL